jgi:hypothetical protein
LRGPQRMEAGLRRSGSADDGLLLTQVPANVFDREEWRW